MLAEAEVVDEAEDEAHGEDRRGDEIAPELVRREGRLQKLRAAKEAVVEPVFGPVKVRQHGGQLSLRGLAGAQGEWTPQALPQPAQAAERRRM